MYGVYQLLTGFKMALATIGIEGGGVLLALLVSYGVKEEKRAALRVWEVLSTILIVALTGLGLFTIIKSSISVGLGMVLAAGLQVYFLAIVHAYATSVRSADTGDYHGGRVAPRLQLPLDPPLRNPLTTTHLASPQHPNS
ncbi:uncharacterized protein LOC135115427 [Scylla paramamosain]|uniref:uncharacterized protein LOC135115427 n=1 Tax=Scylla paramamosain TaxID=85552 RepID=UPI003083432D